MENGERESLLRLTQPMLYIQQSKVLKSLKLCREVRGVFLQPHSPFLPKACWQYYSTTQDWILIPPGQVYPASLGTCLCRGRANFQLLSTVKIDIELETTLLWPGCKECCRTTKLHREAPEHQKCCFIPTSLDNAWAGAKRGVQEQFPSF